MSTGGGPSTSNTNSATTPSASTRSRLLLSSTPSTSAAPACSSTSTTTTPKGNHNPFAVLDDKVFSRHTNTLSADSNRRKIEIVDHNKRLAELRKEAELLDHTDWMYEPVEKLLGK